MRWGLAAVVVVWVGVAASEPFPRFFVEGDGRLALQNANTGEKADVRYRKDDGSYDEAALAGIRRAFRSKGDPEGQISLRLLEVLSHLQAESGVRPLRLVSGYRSPRYNAALRKRGVRAAGGSLHTEGLAADVACPRAKLRDLWMHLRGLDCCGAGYYAKDGFLHVDVGRPRFWEPATSKVEENLSGGNARLFARTEYDRYRAGEPIAVTLHALTLPPVKVARRGWLAREDGTREAITLGDGGNDGCIEVDSSTTSVRVAPVDGARRGRLVLAICEPRRERTPEEIQTGVVETR